MSGSAGADGPGGETDPPLRLENVTHRYGATAAVTDLSFAVRESEVFGLIGPDGAGKTTTLRIALGLIAASEGSVVTCGLDPWRRRRRLTHQVGYLSQRFSLYGDLSVDENLAFFAAIHGVRGWRERRDELLERVRLREFRRRLADQLSGGMRQKLALACTLIHRPRLLILDEPTTGVDPVSRREFWTLLGLLRREGLTLVVTTPYLDEAERCGRVALLHRSRLLALDEPRALKGSVPGTTAEMLVRPHREAARRLRELPGVTEVETFGERLHVRMPEVDPASEGEGAVRRLTTALEGEGLSVELARRVDPTLEDVFIARVRAAETLNTPQATTDAA